MNLRMTTPTGGEVETVVGVGMEVMLPWCPEEEDDVNSLAVAMQWRDSLQKGWDTWRLSWKE